MKKKYKVIFADLDGTLIETLSGETFPKGIWDMKIKFDVLDKIKDIRPFALLIVTNQGGIEKGFVDRRNFEFKMEYLRRSISEYAHVFVEYSYCSSNDKSNGYRKPNIGMLDSLLTRFRKKFASMHTYSDPELIFNEDCLMIGDASGKDGQWSDVDKKTAENFGIDYMDVNDFVSAQ
ncbi:HAD-IIIA family hydrolase [Duncaniella freteri]|uniref:HAD-IIIA family hydrolase n=1 Tax=Duncaniella freteri TaxID=2530391 RepID=UPI0025710660|nr:HAD-IIIA family hydrolase [Duncaniella freteri]